MEEVRIERRGSVVIASFPAHPTPEAMHAFFDRMEEMLLQRPLALVLDAAEVRSAPISVRDAAGRRLKVMEPLLRRSLRGQATVVASPLVRGALATVHFFAPPKYPAKSFGDLASAIRWAEERVAAGVER
jgi:hypothetical protein